MNARRYPRTLQEAFGPYTSRDIEPMPDKGWHPGEKAMAVIALVTAVLIFVGVM